MSACEYDEAQPLLDLSDCTNLEVGRLLCSGWWYRLLLFTPGRFAMSSMLGQQRQGGWRCVCMYVCSTLFISIGVDYRKLLVVIWMFSFFCTDSTYHYCILSCVLHIEIG